MTVGDSGWPPLTANVKRAVSATLDRMHAEDRVTTADEELAARVELERVACRALKGDEQYFYNVAVSNALESENATH